MAKKAKAEECKAGAPAWLATYGDLATLLLCFFVLLFSMSSVDAAKFKAAMSSFANQIGVLPGGDALTDGELLNNGISQLNDIQVVFTGGMPNDADGDDTSQSGEGEEDAESTESEVNPNVEVDPYELAGKIAREFEAVIIEEGLEEEIKLTYTPNYIKFTLQGEFLFDSGKANIKEDAVQVIDAIAEIIKQDQYKDYDIQIEGHTDNLNINSIQYPNNWILSSYRAFAVLEQLIENHGFDPSQIAATGYGEYRPIADNDTPEGRATNRRVEIKLLLDTKEVDLEETELN